MAPLRIIYDCDPGKDDAFAIFLALARPDALDLAAITAVEGNVPVDEVAASARRIVEAAGRPDIPVHRGCARPLLRPLARSEQQRGAGGLEASGLPEARGPVEGPHAISALIAMLEAAPEPIAVAAIGPLTNIALLLVARPDLAGKIGHLYVMGGSEGRGNMTDFAEYNIFVDPHAAAIVFGAELPSTLVTLDTTRDLRPPLDWFEAMAGFGAPGAALLAMWRQQPVALYDVAVTGFLLWPELFETVSCSVGVEIDDAERIGQTRILRGPGPCRLVTVIDAEAFYERIAATLAVYGTPRG